MIDTDKYEGHTEGPWLATHDTLENEMGWVINHDGWRVWVGEKETDVPHLENNRFGSENLNEADAQLMADAPLLLAEVKRLQSEPTVTVDDYHKRGHLYVTVHFPDGEQYVGLVEKWEGEEE